ncbi:MAG: TlpA disulfide reductase family protein [Planctomycetota bacterium]|nr:TlpA disulfide reductase family protein [Planctomycetota bacterium]
MNQFVTPRPKRAQITWIGIVLIICGFLLWVILFRLRKEERDPTTEFGVGSKLPALQLQPLTGATQPVDLKSIEGKVVLLNFWGTWCPPCVREFPHLAAINQEFADRPDFQYLSVSCSGGDDSGEGINDLRTLTERFMQEQNIVHPTYYDANGTTRGILSLAKLFQAYPTTFILDKSGAIRGVWQGFPEGADGQMRSIIESLLGPTPKPPADPPAAEAPPVEKSETSS